MFLLAQQYLLGILLILLVSIVELWALFRTQVIVQDWNNRVAEELLQRYGISAAMLRSGRKG
jgi:hypothetical protein